MQLDEQEGDAGEVAARPGETVYQAIRDWVSAGHKDDRGRQARALGGDSRRAADRYDYIDLATDEIGGQCRQPIVVALCPAVFDRHILPLDIAGFAQSLPKRSQKR